MKKCPKCGMEYPDTENYCVGCGSKLKPIAMAESHEEVRENVEDLSEKLENVEKELRSKHKEMTDTSSSGFSKLTGRLGVLEKHVYKQPEAATNEGLISVVNDVSQLQRRVEELENTLLDSEDSEEGGEDTKELEKRISALEKQVERASKDAVRIVKSKNMPSGDVVDVIEGLGELEGRVDKLEDQLGEIPEPEELDTSQLEKRMGSFEKKLEQMEKGVKSFVSLTKDSEGALNTMDSRLQDFANHSDLSELKKAMAADNEAIEDKLAELASLKDDVRKAVEKMEKAAKVSSGAEAVKVTKWINNAEGTFATKEQLDGLLADVDARVEEKLKPLESFREKVMVVAGLALEQQEKFKEIRSGTLNLVNRRLEQSEASLAKRLEQMAAKMDSTLAAGSSETESAKAKTEGDIAAINESLSRIEEFENRISSELESLKESAAFRHDLESLKEFMESYNARLSTFKQMLAAHTKSLDELSQMKSSIQEDQEHALDDMNSRMDEAVQEIRSQGNGIISDMEKKMNDAISAGVRSVEDTKARMEGEMKLVLDTMSRSQAFEKSVGTQLTELKSEVSRLDGKIKAAVAEEKGALDSAISNELKKLQKISKDSEQRLNLMKDSWDKAIRESMRRNSEEFDKLKKVYAESAEKLSDVDKTTKSMLDSALKDMNRRLQDEVKASSSARKEFESGLREMKITNKDSQEKLAMVKDFIANMETRFSSDIEGLQSRVDGLAKTQRKLEIDGLSPKKKVK